MIPTPCPNEMVHDADDDWDTARYSQDTEALRDIALAWIVRAVHWEGRRPRNGRTALRIAELKERLKDADRRVSSQLYKIEHLERETARLRDNLLSAFQRIKDQADALSQRAEGSKRKKQR